MLVRLLSVSLVAPALAWLILAATSVPPPLPGLADAVAPADGLRLAASFTAPVQGLSGPGPWARFDARNPFLTRFVACFGRPWNELRHAGEDWFAPAGSAVRAVADGRVVSARDANYPGAVVIVEHVLPPAWRTPWGGDTLYSVYAHLEPGTVAPVGQEVRRGEVVGRVSGLPGAGHLHFELRRYADLTGIQVCPANGYTDREGRGYTAPETNPAEIGYLHPSAWLARHGRFGD